MPRKSLEKSILADRVRKALKATGKTDAEIASHVGVHRANIGRFLHGETNNICLDTLEKILELLGWEILPIERDEGTK